MKGMIFEKYGLEFDVHYEFYEGDATVYYYPDGSGYPGIPDTVEIHEVFVGHAEMSEMIDSCCPQLWDQMEEHILEHHK